MRAKKIFITGIGGCVGHYLFDVLAAQPGYRLFLLVRKPERLRFSYRDRANVEIIRDSLQHIDRCADLLKDMDFAIHLAASWGGNQVYEINVAQTLRLFSLLEAGKCQKIIYFSTASLLDKNNCLDPAAGELGSDYIKSKYRCYQGLQKLGIAAKIYTLFPTVILGGDENHPFSHAARELQKIWKYLALIKFFKIDGSFHFIHAHDAALMTAQLLNNEFPGKTVAAGNPVITVDDCIQQLCEIAGIKRRVSLDITKMVVRLVPLFFKKRLSPWDRYALKKRHFRCRVTDLEALGLTSKYDTLARCLIPNPPLDV